MGIRMAKECSLIKRLMESLRKIIIETIWFYDVSYALKFCLQKTIILRIN